jgi:hypothetical protein
MSDWNCNGIVSIAIYLSCFPHLGTQAWVFKAEHSEKFSEIFPKSAIFIARFSPRFAISNREERLFDQRGLAAPILHSTPRHPRQWVV